jgi:hypothetical protein
VHPKWVTWNQALRIRGLLVDRFVATLPSMGPLFSESAFPDRVFRRVGRGMATGWPLEEYSIPFSPRGLVDALTPLVFGILEMRGFLAPGGG